MIRFIVLFIIKLCDYESSTVEDFQFLTLFTIMLIFGLYRLVLGAMVSRIMNKKSMENPKLWGLICFFFGLLSLAVCVLINAKTGNDKSIAKLKDFKIGVSLVCVIAVLFGASCWILNEAQYAFEITEIKTSMEIYGNVPYFDSEKMVYYCYDKMGNRYNGYDFYIMKYYTKDGNAYFCNNEDSIGVWYENEQELEEDSADSFECAVDKDGNAVALDDSFYICCDDFEYSNSVQCFYKKNGDSFDIYYRVSDVGWDKDGNFVLNDEAKSYTQETVRKAYENHSDARYNYEMILY